MGTVYLSLMNSGAGDEAVAIKVLHPHLAANPEMVAMFLDEARLATKFRHENLVRVFDIDLVGDELSIVMEYVEGTTLGNLQSRLRQTAGQKLPLGLTVRVVADALAGLQAVHDSVDEQGRSLGLVHRDFSPQNLLVGTNGATRVTDFGVAFAAGRLASTKPDGTVKGKLQYLAPEQIGRRPLDHRVDVFAAGIVLWECLTGEPLFAAATEAETVTRVLRDPIAPPSTLRPEVPMGLDEACLRALERDPARRFASASDFEAALREAFDATWSAAEVGALVEELAAERVERQRAALQRAFEAPRKSRSWGRGLVAVTAAIAGLAGAARIAVPAVRVAPRSPSSPVAAEVAPAPAGPAVAPPHAPAPERSAPPPAPPPSTSASSPNAASAPPRAASTARRTPGPPPMPRREPAAVPKRPFMPDDL